MSKARVKAMEQAINQAVALRRKVVEIRLPREMESTLLDKTTELLEALEAVEAEQPALEVEGVK